MATFTWIPEFPLQAETSVRMLRAQFGDGYVQRVRDGINVFPRRFRPRFATRLIAEVDAIEAFLKTNCDVGFDWTPADQAAGKWICTGWRRSRDNGTYASFEADFEECFDP